MSEHDLRKADDLLTELVELVETARAVPISGAAMVPREHVLDLLDDLREVLPPEMAEARRILVRRATRLLAAAHAQADALTADSTDGGPAAHRARRRGGRRAPGRGAGDRRRPGRGGDRARQRHRGPGPGRGGPPGLRGRGRERPAGVVGRGVSGRRGRRRPAARRGRRLPRIDVGVRRPRRGPGPQRGRALRERAARRTRRTTSSARWPKRSTCCAAARRSPTAAGPNWSPAGPRPKPGPSEQPESAAAHGRVRSPASRPPVRACPVRVEPGPGRRSPASSQSRRPESDRSVRPGAGVAVRSSSISKPNRRRTSTRRSSARRDPTAGRLPDCRRGRRFG